MIGFRGLAKPTSAQKTWKNQTTERQSCNWIQDTDGEIFFAFLGKLQELHQQDYQKNGVLGKPPTYNIIVSFSC